MEVGQGGTAEKDALKFFIGTHTFDNISVGIKSMLYLKIRSLGVLVYSE